MKVLLNDFISQWEDTREDVHTALEKVGASGWYILGNEVRLFEEELAHYWGMKYSAGCASGLDAIEIGLRVLDLKPGDKVLTTPLSAFATTLAIVRAGGIPVFVDVDETGSIDLDLAVECLEEHQDIKFFVPVHLFGHCLDLDKLEQIKEKYSLRIVEDCAQSIAATWNGRPCGTVGDLAAVSFYPTKNLGCMGDGGAILTDNEQLIEKSRCLRDYGQSERYVHSFQGLNSRLDELQACFLKDVFLKRIDSFTEKRRATANFYINGITNPTIKIVTPGEMSQSCWHLFPVRTRNSGEFREYLTKSQIQSAVHYPVLITDQKALDGTKIEISGPLENAKAFAVEEVSLPIHPYMTQDEIEFVVETCNGWRG